MKTAVIPVDARRRISLGDFASAQHYLLREEAGGVLVLEPADVVSRAQQELDANPTFKNHLRQVMQTPDEELVTVSLDDD